MSIKDKEPFLQQAIQAAQKQNYLGNYKTVDSLLRMLAHKLLTSNFKDGDAFTKEADRQAKALAKVFLGEDKRYPGPAWNQPGQIDVYLGMKNAVLSKDPHKRIATTLLTFLGDLLQLETAISSQKLINEQWQQSAQNIIDDYVRLFLGLPENMEANEGTEPTSNKPKGLQPPRTSLSSFLKGD